MDNNLPTLGRGKCPYCGYPLSSSIKIREQHISNCRDNPDNWDGFDDEVKQWITNLEDNG